MTLTNLHKHLTKMACGLFLASGLVSCDLVTDESDCVSSYNIVKFEYDHNMKFADAFDSEVGYVSMLVFNQETGLLVKRVDISHDDLNDNNETTLDVEPGSYDILVWAGGDDHGKSYDIPRGVTGQSTLGEFRSILRHLDEGEQGKGHIREDLVPLFHSLVHVELPWASPSEPNRVTIPLKKNSNVVRVVLQHLSGDPVLAEDFDMTITDSNGTLEYDNEIVSGNIHLDYHPWYTFSGSVDINTDPEDAPGNQMASSAIDEATRSANTFSACLAEFTVNRLHTAQNPVLKITNKENGKTVLSINLNDYALLVKGFHNKPMSDQEYLDRQDEYNMTFFLDEGNRWVSSCIIINDWRIVRNSTTLE